MIVSLPTRRALFAGRKTFSENHQRHWDVLPDGGLILDTTDYLGNRPHEIQIVQNWFADLQSLMPTE